MQLTAYSSLRLINGGLTYYKKKYTEPRNPRLFLLDMSVTERRLLLVLFTLTTNRFVYLLCRQTFDAQILENLL